MDYLKFMSTESKIKPIGAKKAPELLNATTLVKFAERVILTDKNAALRAQNVSDLQTPSHDSRTPPRVSTLDELCGKSGSVKIKSDLEDDEDDAKLIQFTKPRVGS
jgi:hypothetical protein